jgi:probable HAF family extracellular repeat protein
MNKLTVTTGFLMKLPLLMALVLPSVHAQTWSFVTFDPPGSVFTHVTGINNQGQVVGTYNDASGVTHSFLRQSDGTFSTFDVPQAAAGHTVATAVNNLGQIVGSYQDGAGKSHGFIRSADGSTFTSFDSPDPAIGFTPVAINDQGEVAGNLFVGAGHAYGFFRSADGSAYTRIVAPPNAFYTAVYAMNNSDEIVGFYQLGGSGSPKRGFVRTADGAWADWELPGSVEGTIPNWIDNHGRILAGSVVVNPDRTSFALDASAIAPAIAIPAVLNDNGQIAGASFVGGVYHGFIAAPVSQPTGPTFWSAVLASAFYTFHMYPQDAFAPGEWVEIYRSGRWRSQCSMRAERLRAGWAVRRCSGT